MVDMLKKRLNNINNKKVLKYVCVCVVSYYFQLNTHVEKYYIKNVNEIC